MQEYRIPVIKSDKVFTVEAEWQKGQDFGNQADGFSSEKAALDMAQWWIDESSRKDYIKSVTVTQTIKVIVAKHD